MSDRDELQETFSKSEDDFEKLITYITAGSLTLSLTFIEKIVVLYRAESVCLLIWGWALLTFTLLVNLLSHYYSKILIRKTIYDYDNKVKDLGKKIIARNKCIDLVNIICIFTLIGGLTFLVTFVSHNAINISKTKIQSATTKVLLDDNKKLGRTIPVVKPADQQSSVSESKPIQNNGKGK